MKINKETLLPESYLGKVVDRPITNEKRYGVVTAISWDSTGCISCRVQPAGLDKEGHSYQSAWEHINSFSVTDEVIVQPVTTYTRKDLCKSLISLGSTATETVSTGKGGLVSVVVNFNGLHYVLSLALKDNASIHSITGSMANFVIDENDRRTPTPEHFLTTRKEQ